MGVIAPEGAQPEIAAFKPGWVCAGATLHPELRAGFVLLAPEE